jgi:hypothetical protein
MHIILSITLFLSGHCPRHIYRPPLTSLIPDTNGRVSVTIISGVKLHARTVLGKREFSLLERCPHFRSVFGGQTRHTVHTASGNLISITQANYIFVVGLAYRKKSIPSVHVCTNHLHIGQVYARLHTATYIVVHEV